MVVGVSPPHDGSWFGDAAERLVRTCKLPMLFVPASNQNETQLRANDKEKFGLNLLQSGLTNWCPMMSILKAMGARR